MEMFDKMKNRLKYMTVLMLLFLLLAAVGASGCLKERDCSLTISGMDVSAEKVRSSTVTFGVTTYVENLGPGICNNATIQLKAFSMDTDLLESQTIDSMCEIEKGETANVTQTLELPKKGGYKLVAVLFEGDVKKSTARWSVRNLDNLPADVKDIGIEVEGIDFLVRKSSGGNVVVQNDIYLTNEGARPSPSYEVLVKARETDARLIADKRWTRTGEIKPETTAIRSVNLTVPDQYNYVVEVLIWSNGAIVGRGEDYVELSPVVKLKEDERLESKKIETGKFVVEDEVAEGEYAYEVPAEEASGMPGFGALLAAASLTMITLLRRRSYGR